LIEVVGFLQVAHHLGGDGLLRRERTARHEADHEKCRREDDEQNRNRLEETADDETKHGEIKKEESGRQKEKPTEGGAT